MKLPSPSKVIPGLRVLAGRPSVLLDGMSLEDAFGVDPGTNLSKRGAGSSMGHPHRILIRNWLIPIAFSEA
jgi:hypothetical protein